MRASGFRGTSLGAMREMIGGAKNDAHKHASYSPCHQPATRARPRSPPQPPGRCRRSRRRASPDPAPTWLMGPCSWWRPSHSSPAMLIDGYVRRRGSEEVSEKVYASMQEVEIMMQFHEPFISSPARRIPAPFSTSPAWQRTRTRTCRLCGCSCTWQCLRLHPQLQRRVGSTAHAQCVRPRWRRRCGGRSPAQSVSER